MHHLEYMLCGCTTKKKRGSPRYYSYIIKRSQILVVTKVLYVKAVDTSTFVTICLQSSLRIDALYFMKLTLTSLEFSI